MIIPMPNTTPLQSTLIEFLQERPALDPRFQDIKCLNIVEDAQRRGSLSLVFTAYDAIEDRQVVIKVLDPEQLNNDYRIAAFKREPSVLSKLMNRNRCLKLIFGPCTFSWLIEHQSGNELPFKLDYFVSDWIPEDVDKYFIEHDRYPALEKLKLFRSVVLAIKAIHTQGVMHRDIKWDNLRGRFNGGQLEVIAIDFGAAVHIDDPVISEGSFYPTTVGAEAFSAPEAYAGLRSCRGIGHLTDVYALGALLYQLFNPNSFYHAVCSHRVEYQLARSMLKSRLRKYQTDQDKIIAWKKEMPAIKNTVEPPPIDSRGNSVPKSISEVINKLYQEMVSFDFNKRIQNPGRVVRHLDIAVRILENQKLEGKKLEQKRIARQQRLLKIAKKDQRLKAYLESSNPLIP